MKSFTLALTLLVSIYGYSQDQTTSQEAQLENFVQQCDNIAIVIANKNKTTNINDWYEGDSKDLAANVIQQFEKDINSTPEEISHYLMILSVEPMIFSIHFYHHDTKKEFGHMFVFFNDYENNLVDDVQLVNQAYYEMNTLESHDLINSPSAISQSKTED